jgi:hypothetical protein
VNDGEMREDVVVHVLEKEGCVVEGVEGYAVGSVVQRVSYSCLLGLLMCMRCEDGRTVLRAPIAPS